MNELAILVPVLNRPHRVEPLVKSIGESFLTADGWPGDPPAPDTILFITSPGDSTEQEAVAKMVEAWECCRSIEVEGNYAQKINAGYEATDEPLLFMAADDLDFHPDWFERAKGYLDDGIHVVGTNDICNPRVMCGRHSTHTLFRRSYIERHSGTVDQDDVVLHEGYAHEYADDEFIQVAMKREVYAHAFDSIVEHLHPLVDKAPMDDTYRAGMRYSSLSKRHFRKRQHLWSRLAPL